MPPGMDQRRKTWIVLLLSVLASVCGGRPAAAQNSVTLSVPERAGVDRVNEYVQFGAPLPRDWGVTDVATLRLRDGAGTPIPAQFEALARWGAPPENSAAPVKWVLAGYLQTLTAGTTPTLTLDRGGPGPAPPTAIQLPPPAPNTLAVDTGAAQFLIDTTNNFNLLQQVTVGGADLLEPLSPTAAIHYEPIGALDVVPGGAPDFSARATSVTLERQGPLHLLVKVEGSILDAGARAILDFTARLHFYAGSAAVRLDFTVENNHPVIRDPFDQAGNAYEQGAPHSVYIGELNLNFRLRNTAAALRAMTEDTVDVSAPTMAVRLYQDSSGTAYWDQYVGLVGYDNLPATPRLQAYCVLPGYQITGGAAPVSGAQALGWLAAFRQGAAEPRLLAAVRGFWENFPKALSAAPDGTVSVELFPNGSQFRHNLRIGEEKTHTILLDFGQGALAAAEAQRRARAFGRPLRPVAPAQWIAQTGALGEAPPVDFAQWPLYERYVRTAFEPNPDFDPAIDDSSLGNRTMRESMELCNFYGWQDYGDVPLDYERFGENPRGFATHAGQMNLKYWFLHGMFVQFCRSGDSRWLDLAQPAAWHMADIDYLHVPDEGPQHFVHGAFFGHSQHDEPGNLNPNRNRNSPSDDLFYGVPGLLLGYYLTGEPRFRDTTLEGLEAMANLMQFLDFTTYYDFESLLSRDRANLIFGFIEGYRQTGDARWLARLRDVIAPTCDLSDKPWVTAPAAYGAANPGFYLRMFQFDQTLWRLGGYLDFLDEYGLPDDLNAGAALRAYANFTLNFAMEEFPAGSGRAVHWYDYVFSDPNNPLVSGDGGENWRDVNNWALTMADGLAYAYKYSGERRFLDAAGQFYRTGTIDPQWPDDPPVYVDTKGLANATNWGLVYMNQQRQATRALAARHWWLLK